MKGWLGHINEIPFNGPPGGNGLWGTGYTPEGIDQNPVYYEFMAETNFRETPVQDIPLHISTRSHRRYGLSDFNADVDQAWRLLVASSYSQDLSVQDGTGVPHLGGNEAWAWNVNRYTPSPTLCKVYDAWTHMIAASAVVAATNEPFQYDLINTGREVLAQLAVRFLFFVFFFGGISVVPVQPFVFTFFFFSFSGTLWIKFYGYHCTEPHLDHCCDQSYWQCLCKFIG